MSTVLDAVAALLMLAGAAFALAAAVGVLRFADVLGRMHAATKPQTLGVVLVVAGAALRLRHEPAAWTLPLVAGFQMLTAPAAAHLVGRLGYRTRHVRRDLLHVDELASDPPVRPGSGAGGPLEPPEGARPRPDGASGPGSRGPGRPG